MGRAAELTEQLQSFGRRGAGSDAERRSAAWVAAQISADPRRAATIETFWSRPNWPVAQAWHVATVIVGSLLATTQARPGAGVILLGLAALLADWIWCRSPGRLLSRERASQNVISQSPRPARVRLIITATLDTARLEPDPDWALPGWLFGVGALSAWTLIIALLRIEGSRGTFIAVLQLAPTVGLLVAFSWLLVAAHPGDDAAGVGAALALTRILDAAPPAHLGVDLVITGAGSGDGLGLRRYLAARRRTQDVTNVVVLGLAAPIGTGAGAYYLTSDGPLFPLSTFAPLRGIAHATGQLTPRTGRGCSPALPARLRRLPALSIGGPPDTVVNVGLELVDAIDAYVGELASSARPHQQVSDGRHRVVLGRPVSSLLGRQRKA